MLVHQQCGYQPVDPTLLKLDLGWKLSSKKEITAPLFTVDEPPSRGFPKQLSSVTSRSGGLEAFEAASAINT